MRTAAAWMLLVLTVGCGRRATGPEPNPEPPPPPPGRGAVAWTAAIGPVFSLTAAADGGRTRILALGTEGVTRWLKPDGTYDAGPTLTSRATHLAAGDLNGDGADEILAATPTGSVVAYDQRGKPRWTATIPAAPPLGLLVGPIGPDGATRVVALGQAPLGLTVLDADGRPAWRDDAVRSVLAGCLRPASPRPVLVVIDDRGLRFGYDAAGTRVSQGAKPLVATELLAPSQGLLVAVGVRPGSNTSFAAAVDERGDLRWEVQIGDRLEARDIPAAAVGLADDVTLAAIDAQGHLRWLNENGGVGDGPTIPPPIFCLAAGPRDADGRQLLLVGGARGVVAVSDAPAQPVPGQR